MLATELHFVVVQEIDWTMLEDHWRMQDAAVAVVVIEDVLGVEVVESLYLLMAQVLMLWTFVKDIFLSQRDIDQVSHQSVMNMLVAVLH